MSTKADYTPEEWQALYTAAPMVGLAVAASSPNGPIGVMKEMFSVGMAIGEILQKGSSNQLISSLVDDIRQRGTSPEKPQGVSNMEQAKAAALEHLKKVSDILARKSTPAEADEFKQWLLGIGKRVAEASNEGGFLGFGGTRVSDTETAMLNDLGKTLGATTPA
jgi:hypothetical protein